MKDIYEILNSADPNRAVPEDMEKIQLSESEQESVFQYVTAHSGPEAEGRKKWFQSTAAAAVVVICCIGAVTIPVAAAISHYMNGNTNSNYREIIQKEAVVKEGASEGEFSAKDVKVELMEVSRVDDDYRITCRVEFPETADLTELKAECEQMSSEGRDLITCVDAINEMILVDGDDLDTELPAELGGPNRCLGLALCTDISFEGNVMLQKIELQLDENYLAWTGEEHTFTVCYRDFKLGDQVIEGEWNCDYDVSGSAYEQDMPITVAMNLSGETLEGDVYTLDAYAVTPNGITLYGTQKQHETVEYEYPCSMATARVLAWDDLGNYYLMYARFPEYNADSSEVQQCVFYIYDGVQATVLADRPYLTEWDQNASQVTIALQQVIDSWDEKGTYLGTEYELISEPFTIQLK